MSSRTRCSTRTLPARYADSGGGLAAQPADVWADLPFSGPSGCCSFGESTFAGLLLEGGEERAGSEASVQAVSQKYALLHF